MSYEPRRSDFSAELVRIVRRVRRRWRTKLALRGVLGVVGLGLVVLLLSAYGLETWRFTAGSIIAFRILLGSAVAALVGYLLVRPLMRRATDEQVALYLEECEPSLQAAIISAVEAGKGADSPYSAALVRRLVESAVEKCHALEDGRKVERSPLRRYAASLVAITVAAIALFVFGPAYLRHALSALLDMSRDVEAAAPYKIDVTPGNARVPRGADLTISAHLSGFDSEQAALMVRKSPEAAFEPVALIRGEAGQYEGMLFDLAGPLHYFVEAGGVRSTTFTLEVVDLPYVSRLELEYHFPAYTGLPPQKVEDGGDIAVLTGTQIRARAVPTMPSPGGQVVLSDTEHVPLSRAADGAMTGRFTVEKDGFYRIELDAPTGERVPASPQYTIDALADQPPTVSISKPGRDSTASPIEEVFVEARAEDDFGVRDLNLVYSVNGGPEKSVRLFDGRKRLAEVSAGHTFYLDELTVQPGDFVSYYAKAADNDGVAGPKPAMSDMYFVRIRPLSKDFKRAQSDAQQGGGGGGGNQVGALSEQQRRIIAATFNVQRDRKTTTADKVREHSVVIALSQSRLREQVDGLMTRMNSRLVEQDPAFRKVAELLPLTIIQMKAAEAKLNAVSPEGALPPEQKALQLLQQAEEEYETQVQMQRQQGGGGGGGGSSMAQDLADLFELELDKMANQYETRQQASQQQSDQKLDELMEKLKELARRQEQEAERQRRRAAAGQQQSGGGRGGQSQRALAEQAEEAARRLEQLSREENRPELMQSARQLRDAADAMRKAAANGEQGSGAQASAALDRLKEAERKLQQTQAGRADRDVKNALQHAEEIAREQQQIGEEVKGLDSAGDKRQEKARQALERKAALEQQVGALEKQLDRTAGDIGAQERDAARKLSQAASSIRDNRVRDKIRYSGSMVRAGVPSADQQAMENSIGTNLEDLKKTLGDAASAVGRTKPDAMSQALDKARQLARGVESLDQRMRERGQQSQQGQGQQGQPGQGQQGQRGQQGQGQQGQQGEQGGRNSGERTQDGRGGDGDTTAPLREGGAGFGDRRPGRLAPDDIRQFRGQARQYRNDAQQLRRMVQRQTLDAKALDEVLKNLRALDDDRVYQDVAALERLQTAVAEGMKRFEFNLRRQSEAKGAEVFMSGAEDVPEEYRKLVEQYYKSLSKAPDTRKTPEVKK